MSKNIIVVKDLVKRYKDHVAVNQLSFEVRAGEIFGLLGVNGAGKTTTLEIIETLRKKDAGEIWVNGLSVDEQADAIKRIIGVQLQYSGYYPGLNLVELIRYYADLYNVDVDPLALLESVRLDKKAKAKFEEMSGGQKQSFSLLLSVINKPLVVFLDEPTTGLDPNARLNLWTQIGALRNQGMTVVITTHYMEEAEALCDRVAIVDAGRLIELDTPDRLIDGLLERGFKSRKVARAASLEDVFIDLTGRKYAEIID
jgi:ABC-2 type transport system ATP-binding protein